MILSVVETQKQAPQAQFELKVVTEGKRGNKYVSKTCCLSLQSHVLIAPYKFTAYIYVLETVE